GEEIGMTNGDFKSLDEYMDNETHKIHTLAKKLGFPKWYRMKMIKATSRDNARTPMQWTSHGEFSSKKPWLKMNENTKEINVFDSIQNPDSILNYYKELIRIRKENVSLVNGSFEPLYTKGGLFVFKRV